MGGQEDSVRRCIVANGNREHEGSNRTKPAIRRAGGICCRQGEGRAGHADT